MYRNKRAKEILKKFETSKYEMERHISSFYIAGFTYYEGAEVMEKIKVGTKLKMLPETNNPYDSKAVAIYYNDKKIGYVPREKNDTVAPILNFGHREVFELVVQSKDESENPERQIKVALKVKDVRK